MFHRFQAGIAQFMSRSFFILAVMSVFSGFSHAQVTSGAIFGTVKDQSGAFIENATVSVRDAQTGVERNAVTTENGEFVLPNLPPGTYAISIQLAGFKGLEKTGLVLSAADHLNAGDFVHPSEQLRSRSRFRRTPRRWNYKVTLASVPTSLSCLLEMRSERSPELLCNSIWVASAETVTWSFLPRII